MRLRSNILILGIVILAGALGKQPQAKDHSGKPSAAQDAEESDPPHTTSPESSSPYSPEATLPDGSFNPLCRTESDFTRPPQDFMGDSWRARYQSQLDCLPAAGKKIGFFPFLDLTRNGLSLWGGHGWYLAGNAALARWTTADVAGSGIRFTDPAGIDNAQFVKGEYPETIQGWAEIARRHPSFQTADYILTGLYRDADNGKVDLAIYLVDVHDDNLEELQTLYQYTAPAPKNFLQFASQQRVDLEAAIDALIERGITSSRTPSQLSGIDLDEELKTIALLYDCNDSWGIMEGIDRALALATLYPDSLQPMQAAAYGYSLLNDAYFDSAYVAVYRAMNQMSNLALAQVLMCENSSNAMNRLLWMIPVVKMDYLAWDDVVRSGFLDDDGLAAELEPLENLIVGSQEYDLSPDELNAWPDILVFELDRDQLAAYRESSLEQYCINRRNYWTQADAFQWLIIHNSWYDRPFLSPHNFTELRLLTQTLSGVFAARHAAAFLSLEPDQKHRDEVLDALVKAWHADRKSFTELAKERNYFKIRRALWQQLDHKVEYCPNYIRPEYHTTLEVVTPRIKSILAAQVSQSRQSLSAFADFEFTPARRLQFYQQTEHLALIPILRLNGSLYCHYESLVACMTDYLRIRPDNPSLLDDYADELDGFGDGDAVNRRAKALEDSLMAWPWPSSASKLAFVRMYQQRPEEALSLAAFYDRQDAFNPQRFRQLGNLYYRYGYNQKALDYYTKFLEILPDDFDASNRKLMLLCELGRQVEMDQTIRTEMHEGITKNPHEYYYHIAYIKYLFNWAADYEKGLEVASRFRAWVPNYNVNAAYWEARCLKKLGRTEEAVGLLNALKPHEDLEGLALASFYTAKADTYFELERVDLAEKMIDKAKQIDSWKGDVIRCMGRLAMKKKDYYGALAEFRRCVQRYGPNVESYRMTAECYLELGQPQTAISILEQVILSDSPHDWMNRLIPDLMKLYVESGQTGRCREMLDRILQSGVRNTEVLSQTLDAYESVNPTEAKHLREQLPRIIAEPHSLDSLLDQPAS